MNEVIDFDKMFEEYAMEWFKEHEDDYETAEQMESDMPDIYERWASSPSHKLGGIAPRAFFDSIEKPQELIGILVGTSEGECNPCSLLMDKIAETPECAPLLAKVIEQKTAGVKLKMLCVNLLTESGSAHPLNIYTDWIKDKTVDADLRELGIEVLCEHADEVKQRLFDMIDGADIAQKTVIAEILINAERDERTFKLLSELFAEGDNIPLYAGYIGKYGDERAAAQLYRALDSCNYMEYIEIKNAIERMGGVVDDVRDFSDDVYYKALKGIK